MRTTATVLQRQTKMCKNGQAVLRQNTHQNKKGVWDTRGS